MPAKDTISQEVERHLIRVAQERLSVDPKDPVGLDARDRVIAANMTLVTVPRLHAYREAHGISTEDSFQMTWIALVRAVRDFDLDRYTNFGTYAVYKIFGEISAMVANSRNREFTLSTNSRDHDYEYQGGCSGGEDVTFFLQNVSDRFDPRSDEEAEDRDLDRARVLFVLESWESCPVRRRHAVVLRKRFGLDGSPPATLEQVGRSIGGLSKERARQLQVAAMRQFRRDYTRALDSERYSEETEVSLARA